MHNHLPVLFAIIEPARRQSYANFVETAFIITVSEGSLRKCDDALRGIAFPKQKLLRMYPRCGQIYVPVIENHRLTILDIDPPFDVNPITYGMTRDEMETILEQTTVSPIHLSDPYK